MEGKRCDPAQDDTTSTTSSGTVTTASTANRQDSPGDDPLSDGYRYKPDGLMKQSFSIQTTNNLKLHLISYFSRSHVTANKLIQPSMDPNLKNITIPNGLYPDASSPFDGPSHPFHPIQAHVAAVAAAAAGLGSQMLGGPRPPPPPHQGYPVQVPPQYHQSPYSIQQNMAQRQPEGPPPPRLPYYNMNPILHSRSQQPPYPYPNPPHQQPPPQLLPHQQSLHQQPPPPLQQQQPPQSLQQPSQQQQPPALSQQQPSQTSLRPLQPLTTDRSSGSSSLANSPVVTTVKLHERKASPLAPAPSKVQKGTGIPKSPRLKLPPPSSFLKEKQIAGALGQSGLLLQQRQQPLSLPQQSQQPPLGVPALGQSVTQSVLGDNAPTGGEDGKRLPGLSSFSVQDIPYEKVTWGEDVRAIQVLDKGFSL
ncbi:hypothetical protein D0Z00_002867 [Geotrichum galactomycetum]|uniref:Uncharacterized protein n=1 Tax=Geotrichum galactomycetum TaxID=27317 RepID=A0ACB6V301_9ASCO|nr:hypothetical protein D0Z00_002867 [Geotrichum candidum]